MGRIRQVKPEFFEDEKLGALTRDQRLFLIGLFTQADDFGLFRAAPAYLRAAIFPYDDDVTAGTVSEFLNEVSMRIHIVLYEVSGERFGAIIHFRRHQQIQHAAKKPKHPPPPPGVFPEVDEVIEEFADAKFIARWRGESSMSPHEDSVNPHSGVRCQGSGVRDQGSGHTHTRARADAHEEPPPDLDPATTALAHLAEVAGVEHEPGPNLRRLAEEHGETFVADACLVVDHRWQLWGPRPEMHSYMRPSTLFGPKWPEYLAEARAWEKHGRPDLLDAEIRAAWALKQAKDPDRARAMRERAVGGRP